MVFEGTAKLRLVVDPNGSLRINAKVKSPSPQVLEGVLRLLVRNLCGADDATLARMAKEMREQEKDG
jgi:hypothetical protein